MKAIVAAFAVVLAIGLIAGVTTLAATIGGILGACGVLAWQANNAPKHTDMDREQS